MRVLIADDVRLDRSILKLALEKWEYEVVEAVDGQEAMSILQQDDAPALVILDWMMPGMSGPEICRSIRSATRQRYTYIILLTSKDETNDLVDGMKSGADDYLVKPVNIHELQVRLRAGSRIIELEQELIRTREELRVQATHDFLTGIWNRGVVLDRLNEEIERAARHSSSLSVIIADIDHFKGINDNYGHSTGDTVLVEVAQRIQKTIRPYDIIGRFGGEEFLVVVPDIDEAGTAALAERVRSSICSPLIETKQGPVEITLSIGTTVCQVKGNVDPTALIEEADRALYQAKRNGRNRVEAATPIVNA